MPIKPLKANSNLCAELPTRELIMQAAQAEIHRVGFRSTSVSQILKDTGLTKGAFYHHFKSKDELGLAIVNESLKKRIEENWLIPLSKSKDPVSALISHLMEMREQDLHGELVCGCPLNNISQEMSSVDERFRLATNNIFEVWICGFEELFKKGQKNGTVATHINARAIATFIITSLQGIVGLTKNSQSTKRIDEGAECMLHFLNSLRPVPKT